MPARRDRAFALGATVVVIAVLGLGFYNAGSPRVQRQLAIDRARVERLRQIASEIHNRPALPTSLDDIRNTYLRVTDPETDEPFEYRVKDPTHYELCAKFTSPSIDWEQKASTRERWAHPAGRYCFTLDSKANPWGY